MPEQSDRQEFLSPKITLPFGSGFADVTNKFASSGFIISKITLLSGS
jgi:hypothetical protein